MCIIEQAVAPAHEYAKTTEGYGRELKRLHYV